MQHTWLEKNLKHGALYMHESKMHMLKEIGQ